MKTIEVLEEELKCGDRIDTLKFTGITSCLTVTLVVHNALIGLHIVQNDKGEKPYYEKLDNYVKLMNGELQGREVKKVIIVGPLKTFRMTDVRAAFYKAFDPEFDRTQEIDMSKTTSVQDVYIHGTTNTVEIKRGDTKLFQDVGWEDYKD